MTPWGFTPAGQSRNSFVDWSHRSTADVWQQAVAGDLLARLAPFAREPQGLPRRVGADGWIAVRLDPPDPGLTLRRHTDINFRGGNTVSPSLVSTLLARVRCWRESGIRVFAVRPPVAPAILDAENRLSGFDEATFVEQFTAAGGVWLTIEGTFETADGSHLQDTAAEAYSAAVAERIADILR